MRVSTGLVFVELCSDKWSLTIFKNSIQDEFSITYPFFYPLGSMYFIT